MAKKLLNQKKYFPFATLFKHIKVGHVPVHFLYSFLFGTYTIPILTLTFPVKMIIFLPVVRFHNFEKKKNGKSGSPSELSKC